MAKLRIGVVGAGIGGTTAALALIRAGHTVMVFEQARTIREVGAGIPISPNASRVLGELGLSEALAVSGCGRTPGISADGITAAPC